MASIFNKLDDVKETDEAAEMFETIQEATAEIDELDDVLRATIQTNDEFTTDDFDNKTIQELREHIEYIADQLDQIKNKLY